MQALVPGFDALSVDSVEDVRVGIAWTENADPLVRKRVEGVAERFARRVDLRLPTPEEIYEATYKQFMQEVATVHRELFDEYADAYGENVRLKIERCLRITDSEADAARASRDEIRERFFEATRDVDLLLTPTVPFVAPPSDADEIAFRKRGISLTYPFNCLGWPALALPCGAAESGLPSSAQLVGKPDDDALVLGVGASLVRGTAAA
jgi:aspartyl-tRNA(Asn)/glutamyl-tRNA(Gln) amidotransferase subunit A